MQILITPFPIPTQICIAITLFAKNTIVHYKREVKVMKHFRSRWILIIVALVIVLSACTGNNQKQSSGKGKIVFGLNNWAENVAVSHMWKILLNEKGYDVQLKSMQKAPVWLGISKGELDIAPEVWLPNTDKKFKEQYGSKVEMHKIWYKNTRLGLVVPTYMNIDSITQLNAKKKALGLGDNIIGIDPGASLTSMAKNAIKEYHLNYQLLTSSGPAMMSALKKAYAKKNPIVVTLWNPHWAFSQYKLKYLKDPKGVFGKSDNIYYMTRKGFGSDHPEIIKWMNNWSMDDQSLGSLMATIKKMNDPDKGAKKWIDAHRDLVNSWMK